MTPQVIAAREKKAAEKSLVAGRAREHMNGVIARLKAKGAALDRQQYKEEAEERKTAREMVKRQPARGNQLSEALLSAIRIKKLG